MTTIPARSMLSIQLAAEKLIDSKIVTNVEEITVKLKSQVYANKNNGHELVSNHPEEYSLVAAE